MCLLCITGAQRAHRLGAPSDAWMLLSSSLSMSIHKPQADKHQWHNQIQTLSSSVFALCLRVPPPSFPVVYHYRFVFSCFFVVWPSVSLSVSLELSVFIKWSSWAGLFYLISSDFTNSSSFFITLAPFPNVSHPLGCGNLTKSELTETEARHYTRFKFAYTWCSFRLYVLFKPVGVKIKAVLLKKSGAAA